MAPSCPHCEHPYTTSNPPKQLINCPHSLCLTCLATQILCPLDHKRIQRRKYTLEAFATNLQILALIKNDGQIAEEECQPAKNEQYESSIKDDSVLREQNSNTNKVVSPEKKQIKEMEHEIQEQVCFEHCLLHGKKADLICLEHKCMICANCGLFGQHKNHNLVPFDKFALDFGTMTEQCLRISEQIKQKYGKTNIKMIETRVDAELRLKKNTEQRKITQFTANIIKAAQSLQKELLNQLQKTIEEKRKKLLQASNLVELSKEIDNFDKSIDILSNGLNSIFSIHNIQTYIPYLDQANSKSNITTKGQEILSKIDQQHQQFINNTKQTVRSFAFQFESNVDGIIQDMVRFQSKNIKKKRQETKRKEEYLICEGDQLIEMSPIGPLKNFDDNSHSQFLAFVDPQQIVLPSPNRPQSSARNSVAFNKVSIISKKNERSDSVNSKDYSISKSKDMSNSNHSERELLSFLGTQTISKKKKVDLPGKYGKIYDEFMKDQLDVLDLGGAFLGQATILKISESIPSRTKLKSIKLMNNKLGDEIFSILVERCKRICSLNLSYNNFTEKVLEYLESECEQLGYLENITLSNNKIVLRNVKDRLEVLRRRGLKVSL